MKPIADSGVRGKVVQANMTTLAQKLDQGAGTMYIAADIFADDDIATIGEEDIKITTHGTTCTVVRAQNGTQDVDHGVGQEVQKSPGTVLVSHQFDSQTYLAGIRCGGNAEARFGVAIDGILKYQASSSYADLERFWPCVQHKPGDTVTYTVYVWLKYSVVAAVGGEAVFWAEIQSY